MPQHLSVEKRIRQNKTRNLRNRSVRSNLRSTIKKVTSSLEANNTEEALASLKEAIPTIDKAASKGILHKNNAARKKSRLMRKVNALTSSKG